MDKEGRQFAQEVKETRKWMNSTRFEFTKRPYDADAVVRLRGTVTPEPLSNVTARKLYSLTRSRFQQKSYTHTFGALDPVQVTQMAKYIETVYVSGWQCSSTASTSNEPGPDFASYSCDTVPSKVDQLFRAQLFHDRKQHEARMRMTPQERSQNPPVDYLRPIIADGDVGFGGVDSICKLLKMMIERGASGVHLEDQKIGAKKCGHMGGKVLVSTQEHIDRLVAARLQADVMKAETVLIARTDASSATYIDSNVDSRDHPFIVGATVKMNKSLRDVLKMAQMRSASGAEIQELETSWRQRAQLKTFPQAVRDALKRKRVPQHVLQAFDRAVETDPSHSNARRAAIAAGVEDLYFDWDLCRSREGYYRWGGCTDACVSRACSFSPVADLIWMETATPNVPQAAEFSNKVHAKCPNQMLAYNLSPSFNWDAAGMKDKDIQSFRGDLGKLGFAWQFITLCGFHSNALKITEIARELSGPRAMLAYVQDIQRQERQKGVETLTHQKWSGTEIADFMLSTATGGAASTGATHGATEAQFGHSKM